MDQIIVETNVVEFEATQRQAEESLVELNAGQLALIGGGAVAIIID